MDLQSMDHPENKNTGHIDEKEVVARDQEVAIMLSSRAGNTVRGTGSFCLYSDVGRMASLG